MIAETIGDQFDHWNLLVRKEKSIYHTLNMLSLDVTKKCLVAEGWSPIYATKQIQDALDRARLTLTPKLVPFSKFCILGSHHPPISGQINSLLHFNLLLMHTGVFYFRRKRMGSSYLRGAAKRCICV
ncbi:hypothetical protein K1719_041131 [Acacia pycnantha]|nr:hypothetical protein K1719_041131 [Acacia pycnantha]